MKTSLEKWNEERIQYHKNGWNVLKVCFWISTIEIIIVLFALKSCSV